MQKRFSHEIVLDMPVDAALPLFTPLGEEDWVPGWKPTYLQPPDGETGEEMLFVTGEGEEKTYWTCLKWRPEVGHVRYLRLVPTSRVSFVDVTCAQDSVGRTKVRVIYEHQALSTAGEIYLAGLTDEGFRASIDEWATLIGRMA